VDAPPQQEESPSDPNLEWEFGREFFEDLTVNVKDLYAYEATVRKLARKLWPNIHKKDDMTLSGPEIFVKIGMEWEQWEYDHPEHTRGGYNINPEVLLSKEMMENQPEWQKEWMRRTEGALEIYRNSPRHLRVDPTFCPCPRRYSWEEFAEIQARCLSPSITPNCQAVSTIQARCLSPSITPNCQAVSTIYRDHRGVDGYHLPSV